MKILNDILLAEDDLKDVELTLTALKETNLANRIVVVNDGEEALDYLYKKGKFSERQKGNPVVMLLDLKMPKVTGIEVLKQVKSDTCLKTIPVVIVTSSRESQDLKLCYELGVNAYVVKPVNFPEFMCAIKKVGIFWGLVNVPPP